MKRVAVKVNVKPVTLSNWVKAATPASAKGRPAQPGSVEERRAQVAGLSRLPIKGVTAFLDAHRDESGLRYGVIGAAVGSLFVFKGRYHGVDQLSPCA